MGMVQGQQPHIHNMHIQSSCTWWLLIWLVCVGCCFCACVCVCDAALAVLNYLYSKDKLGLIDIVTSDPNRTLTAANYIHAIHMEVCVCMRGWGRGGAELAVRDT